MDRNGLGLHPGRGGNSAARAGSIRGPPRGAGQSFSTSGKSSCTGAGADRFRAGHPTDLQTVPVPNATGRRKPGPGCGCIHRSSFSRAASPDPQSRRTRATSACSCAGYWASTAKIRCRSTATRCRRRRSRCCGRGSIKARSCLARRPRARVRGQRATADPEHWSYVKPARPELPAVARTAWPRTPIDRFVLARLEREKLTPSPDAPKATLLRRVSLDLTGLPPSPAELDAFLADTTADAYDRVVDRLLASPRYGERWARPWLDLARYADTNGLRERQPAQHLEVSRLGDRRAQPRSAVRPVHDRADRRRHAAGCDRPAAEPRAEDRDRLPPQRDDQRGRRRRSRRVDVRSARGSREHDRDRVARQHASAARSATTTSTIPSARRTTSASSPSSPTRTTTAARSATARATSRAGSISRRRNRRRPASARRRSSTGSSWSSRR